MKMVWFGYNNETRSKVISVLIKHDNKGSHVFGNAIQIENDKTGEVLAEVLKIGGTPYHFPYNGHFDRYALEGI